MSHRILNNRLGLIFILLAVFTVNYIQTQMATSLNNPAHYETGYEIAQAFMELEGNLDFSQFEGLGEGPAVAHSISYYILFPVLLLAVIAGLLFRREITPFRVMTLGLAISYVIALCFFIFFPVPERWAFPPANATLLSDIVSTGWIESYRSFRALDNAFPSLFAAFTSSKIPFACWASW